MCVPYWWCTKHAQLIMGTWPIYKKHFLQLILTKKPSFDKISDRDFYFFSFLFNLYLLSIIIMYGGWFKTGTSWSRYWVSRCVCAYTYIFLYMYIHITGTCMRWVRVLGNDPLVVIGSLSRVCGCLVARACYLMVAGPGCWQGSRASMTRPICLQYNEHRIWYGIFSFI